MTATEVNGRAVLAVEPAVSKWIDADTGQRRLYKSVVRLLLDDGTEVYGCTRCDYTAERSGSVGAHQRVHGPISATPAPAPATPSSPAKRPAAAGERRPGAGTPADRSIRGRPTVADRQRAVTAEAALYRIRALIDEVLPR